MTPPRLADLEPVTRGIVAAALAAEAAMNRAPDSKRGPVPRRTAVGPLSAAVPSPSNHTAARTSNCAAQVDPVSTEGIPPTRPAIDGLTRPPVRRRPRVRA